MKDTTNPAYLDAFDDAWQNYREHKTFMRPIDVFRWAFSAGYDFGRSIPDERTEDQ